MHDTSKVELYYIEQMLKYEEGRSKEHSAVEETEKMAMTRALEEATQVKSIRDGKQLAGGTVRS